MTNSELIRAVAEKVMGWNDNAIAFFHFDLTNPAHWMMVVERMRDLGYRIDLFSSQKAGWFVRFYHEIKGKHYLSHYLSHQNLGHAVCEAALKALGSA